jgi:hypothetical protein
MPLIIIIIISYHLCKLPNLLSCGIEVCRELKILLTNIGLGFMVSGQGLNAIASALFEKSCFWGCYVRGSYPFAIPSALPPHPTPLYDR